MSATKRDQAKLVNYFKSVDVNNDGYINFDEFKQVMEKYDPKISIAEVARMFKKMDKDGNGNITLEEYIYGTMND